MCNVALYDLTFDFYLVLYDPGDAALSAGAEETWLQDHNFLSMKNY